jgi:HlyD family type I secretion membrane fusion protein
MMQSDKSKFLDSTRDVVTSGVGVMQRQTVNLLDRWGPDSIAAEMGTRGPMMFGTAVFLLFFGGFGLWSALAPMDSAAIAPGFLVAEGNRKQIQHFEGGIIEEIFVKEGEMVDAGQTLVILDDTQAQAGLDLLRSQFRASAALEARLIAERDRQSAVTFPDWLIEDVKSSGAEEVLDGQQRIFAARREAMVSQTGILGQRTRQIREEIIGLEGELRAQNEQLSYLREEEASVKDLLERNFVSRPRLLALQREISELEGERAQNLAGVARARQSIGENELRTLDLEVQILNEAVARLRDEQTLIADLKERIRGAEDVLERMTIIAPVAGRIVDLKVFTQGGVIAPRESMMGIVPREDALIVSAQVSPIDIDVVSSHLPVQLRFSALNQRITPTLTGTVLNVSADRLTDERTGNIYFEARIAIDVDQPGFADVTMYPGMPVEAMIVTGERTLFEYLTKPISNSISRALTEA